MIKHFNFPCYNIEQISKEELVLLSKEIVVLDSCSFNVKKKITNIALFCTLYIISELSNCEEHVRSSPGI